jgi:hypothetical protein
MAARLPPRQQTVGAPAVSSLGVTCLSAAVISRAGLTCSVPRVYHDACVPIRSVSFAPPPFVAARRLPACGDRDVARARARGFASSRRRRIRLPLGQARPAQLVKSPEERRHASKPRRAEAEDEAQAQTTCGTKHRPGPCRCTMWPRLKPSSFP